MNGAEAARYHKEIRRVARNFARAAPGYDTLAQFQQTVGKRLVEILPVMNIRPTLCADLGSGTGNISDALRKTYPATVCVEIDLAEAMLRAARPRWPWRRSRRRWICADAGRIPIRSECIDLAASNLMLQWCNEPDYVLAEAYRTLRPGGLLLFSTLGRDTLMELRDSWRGVDDDVHVNAFMDIHGLGAAVIAAGFASPVLETERFTLTYADGLALMRDLKRLGTANSNAGRRRSLTGKGKLSRMLQCYERYRDGDRLPATYEVIYAHAWRPAQRTDLSRAGVATVPISAIRRRSG
ncbi:MAG: malonyl-ACP O-methyltransferase BioC [Gammaproteobacteria bacterium]|nr:malonyl-ACP O-methyltransferase BioC [Gammaproteobacteria bacterium]